MSKYDITLMNTAKLWAEHSVAKMKVGAVFVIEHRIIAHGYNGTPAKLSNRCEDKNGTTFPWVIHAEENALLFAAKIGLSVKDSTLYVTHSPCTHCAAALIQAGVKTVIYETHHVSRTKGDGLTLLQKAGIAFYNYKADGHND